uniref:Uncharacterized protein LOC117359685 n=1 Tax=Geotrypetes seraphini TaxID=260995 RepID=A0A6P8QJF9_GEOSA|nr:uncharacterized protein LOC117359685 [Geotrypetes seraphini]
MGYDIKISTQLPELDDCFLATGAISCRVYISADDMENLISEIKQEFITSMKESLEKHGFYAEVKELVQASVHTDVKKSLDMHVSVLIEPSFHTRLYFCGGLDQPERLKEILISGFSIQDFQTGIYGKGLYFSSRAYTACKFSPVPGRLSGCFSSQEPASSQEFVIFSHLQASFYSILNDGALTVQNYMRAKGLDKENTKIDTSQQATPYPVKLYRQQLFQCVNSGDGLT